MAPIVQISFLSLVSICFPVRLEPRNLVWALTVIQSHDGSKTQAIHAGVRLFLAQGERPTFGTERRSHGHTRRTYAVLTEK